MLRSVYFKAYFILDLEARCFFKFDEQSNQSSELNQLKE